MTANVLKCSIIQLHHHEKKTNKISSCDRRRRGTWEGNKIDRRNSIPRNLCVSCQQFLCDYISIFSTFFTLERTPFTHPNLSVLIHQVTWERSFDRRLIDKIFIFIFRWSLVEVNSASLGVFVRFNDMFNDEGEWKRIAKLRDRD